METATSPRKQIPPTKFSFSSPEQSWRPGSVRLPSVALPDIRHRESFLIDVLPDILNRESIFGLYRWIPA